MKNFFATVCIVFEEPVAPIDQSEDGSGNILGYYANLGVAAEDREQAMKLITNLLNDGRIDWSRSEWKSLNGVDPSLTAKADNLKGEEGIWYKSGRSFFC